MNALLVVVALLLGCGVLGRHNITTLYSDPSIVYSGIWTPGSDLANSIACGGAHTDSNDSSATATWQFTGVAFYYMAPQWAYPVNTIINIDNGNVTTNIDLDDHSLPQTRPGLAESVKCSVLWASGELENGQHTVVASMPQGGPPFVVVDAFVYTVLDPGDVQPVTTTTETSATIVTSATVTSATVTSATTTTPTTAGSSASSVALSTKKSNSVSIPMVAGIAAAIAVVAIVILFLLCYRMRRAAYANEEAAQRIYSPETPPGFQPSNLMQQSAPVPIVNAVPEPAGQHFWQNRGNPPRPVRELIDYEPAWLSGAHRPTFAAPTAHSLEFGNVANDVAAELWTAPQTAVFAHNNGIQMAEKQPRMGETGINGSRAEQPEHQIDIKTVPADPPALGLQNFSPTSQNEKENHEERGKIERAFGNHQFGTHHSASDYTQVAHAVVGTLPSTSQQLRPSPASLQHIEEDYRGIVPGDLYGERTPQVFNEEPPPQYERPENNPQRRFECGVCMDVQPEDDVTFLDPCKHNFCRNCIKNHIGSQLSERRFPILCPVCKAERGTTNPGIVTDALVQQAGITEEQYKIWVELEMARFSVPLHCRKCNRSFNVDRQDLEQTDTISCPLRGCSHIWCKKCQQTVNGVGPQHSCNGESELNHLMTERGWKYCPSCKTPIEKEEGCNHMTCISPGCYTHFCYICGESIIRSTRSNDISAAIDAHYRSCKLN